ncbi:MAG: flagellar motor protein MotA [Acidobacteria bacterium]|jgi:biopolymer transport protein ExbB/biopolymer transport protein TolQ|nr:flagellar motor protein MotA [Acidobacteriota bacterium]MXX87123.1 flagellar motor protein MotA [Acidobacteriota bacterium]MYE43738.1 flagellar motor protein MotA [Acidobacteriota bacterium]MYF77380.1 flagellar motor protein MotA [Acidobacteriota bacterium]MYG75915.1 flagellar motor protein MotA [Acidobacteriota bacterium]
MSFDLLEIWSHMGPAAKLINGVMAIMSVYSLSVMIERWLTYQKAKGQSRGYSVRIAKELKAGNIDSAIKVSKDKDVKNSHLAKVLLAGLQEIQFQTEEGSGDKDITMEAAHRAIQRATAISMMDLRRNLSGLATVGATAPFVGLLGTVLGIITAFRGMALTGSGGIGAVSAGIAEALIATAFGLFVAIPAVWAFNYLTNRADGFGVEMDNGASELIDFMARR